MSIGLSKVSYIYFSFILLDSLKLDHGICENVKSITMTSSAQLDDLQRGHCEKTTLITGNADRSLGEDYTVGIISLLGICTIYVVCLTAHTCLFITFLIMDSFFMDQVDEVTFSTPKRREIKIPSSQSIGELVTPPLEDLVKTFWDTRTPTKLSQNGNGKHDMLGSTTPETQRAPLTTIN